MGKKSDPSCSVVSGERELSHRFCQTLSSHLNNLRRHSKSETNASFLRAARAGNLDKVLEFLKDNIDINVSNSVCLSLVNVKRHQHSFRIRLEISLMFTNTQPRMA